MNLVNYITGPEKRRTAQTVVGMKGEIGSVAPGCT